MKDRDVRVVAAAPGWEMGEVIDGTGEVYWVPVVAWAIEVRWRETIREYEFSSRPIPGDPCVTEDHAYLKMPDGRLFAPFDRDFENEAELLAYHERKRERMEKAQGHK